MAEDTSRGFVRMNFRRKIPLSKPKTIWLDDETYRRWEKLKDPRFECDVVEEIRDAIRVRLEQIEREVEAGRIPVEDGRTAV